MYSEPADGMGIPGSSERVVARDNARDNIRRSKPLQVREAIQTETIMDNEEHVFN